MDENNLILVDQIVEDQKGAGVFVSWSDMIVPSEVISLPAKTEEQAIDLKKEFLQWLYNLGKSEVDGKSLVAHLQLFNNLSFWWLTSVAEKSPFLCRSIFQVFKLRTLEKIYSDNHCNRLVYQGNNEQLHLVLRSWALEMGHIYERVPLYAGSQPESYDRFSKKLISKLPHLFQAILWFMKKGLERWRHVNFLNLNAEKNNKSPRLTIVTFFPNVHIDLIREGNFRSKYWERLHDHIDKEELPIDWVWFYFGSTELSFKETAELKEELNRKSKNNQSYFLLEEFLSSKDLWKSIILFFKLRKKAQILNQIHKNFRFQNSKINFFHIMKSDWDRSFFGIGAIEKVLWAIMFDSMSRKLPASLGVLYTWENQTWERALVAAFKRHQTKSKVIGYEHSSVRLMDLRLFSDPRIYQETGVEEFPIPDMLGVNSSVGLEWLRESKYPEKKIARIEALRYFHLSRKYGCLKKPIVSSLRKLLIVTGIIPTEAHLQIKLLKQACEDDGLKKYDEVWIKPHPGLALDPILKELKPKFKLTIVDRPLFELMEQSDVVYCANSTGASLEAAWLGVPLIILAAMDSMNLNPLFGFPGQHFVKDCAELVLALENPNLVDIPKDYFYLDENLGSWDEILRL